VEIQLVLTIVHLLPSSSFLVGFFTRMLSGLGFLPGAGLLARAELPSETVEETRREGFLCVISDLSTLRKPLVTASPLFNSEKTAPRPPGAAVGAASDLTSSFGGGPGGGGGGGGGPPVPAVEAGAGLGVGMDELLDAEARDFTTDCAVSPLGFQGMPLEKCCFTSSLRSRNIW
jgi:hypothetical protein